MATSTTVPARPVGAGQEQPLDSDHTETVAVSLIGSTGSIGTQALEVIEGCPERFEVVAIGANRSVEALAAQAVRLRPRVVAIGDPALAPALAKLLPSGVELVAGTDGLASIATVGDVAVNGIVGFAGLTVTLAALEAGRRLALANKESIIAGAPVVQRARRTAGAEIIPVDSEHCAVHQCLRSGHRSEVTRLLLTASGGPFRRLSREQLASVTVAEALVHPTWSMGPKITVDSSTLMNKGLEVIEAHELFGIPYDAIDVLTHPQSIVHSMVEFSDGAVVAQLSMPDMRLPIGYALAYPDRLPTAFGPIDWTRISSLEFEPPDRSLFPCLDIAYRAGRAGDLAPAWLNAANEVAVEAFLAGRISWNAIAEVVEGTLDRYDAPSTSGSVGDTDPPTRSVDDVLGADAQARRVADVVVAGREGRMSATDTLPAASSPVESVPPEPTAEEVKSPQRLAAELIGAIAVIVALSVATGHAYLLIVIASIVAIVMVHELGHFLAAKHGGMKVTEYFVGFGPRLWSFRRGETEYGVKALPLGGYVKIPGMTNLEEVDPSDEGRLYRDKPFHARLLVAVAGSAMHFLMAFVLLIALVTLVGVPNNNQVQVQGVSALGGKPGPAAAGGIRAGDVVLSVNGRAVGGNPNTLTSVIEDHPGGPLVVVVERGGQRKTLTVTPVNGRTHHEAGALVPKGSAPYGIIGVSLGQPTERIAPLRSLGTSVADLGHLMGSSVAGVGRLFSPGGVSHQFAQVTSAKAASTAAANGTRVTSIVGVVQVATQAAQTGIGNFLYILIVINVFFGIFNLFPMLPLDGGHVAIAVYEKIRTGRRKVMYHADVAKMMPFAWLMMLVLAVIILPALLTDILHPVTG